MSEQNVERLRRSYEAFNVTGEVDLDLWATDIEYIQTAYVGAGRASFVGGKASFRQCGSSPMPFEGLSVEPERFFDLGDRVLAFVRLRGRSSEGRELRRRISLRVSASPRRRLLP
jgi:ketosteroid isomerase-like protein